MDEFGDDFDFVIVGAGSAGCVVARRLADRQVGTVALIEAGGRDHNPWFHIPIGFHRTRGSRHDWCFTTEPEQATGGRAIDWPRGRVLGGSSSLNGMLYVRGARADFDAWAAQGLPGWDWVGVEPYFQRAEAWQETEPREYGRKGLLPVSNARFDTPLTTLAFAAGEATGLPVNTRYNAGDNSGLVRFDVTMRDGRRASTARAYLPGAPKDRLAVLTEHLAEAVLIEEGRATGLRVRSPDGGCKMIRARRGVILCAGAIGSPHLLQLSGIGPGNVLRGAGIAMRLEAPGVGANLQDHYQAKLIFDAPDAFSLNGVYNSLFRRIGAALHYATTRRGVLAMGAAHLGAFLRSDPTLSAPDLQWHVFAFSLTPEGRGLLRQSQVTVAVCLLTPASRGSVEVRSPDPATLPLIHAGYLSAEVDRLALRRGLRSAQAFFGGPGFRAAGLTETATTAMSTDDALDAHMVRSGSSAFHPVGTCAMGAGDKAPLDEKLRLRGVERLWVADASVMPMVTRGNTNAPTIMIAEKASDLIEADVRA